MWSLITSPRSTISQFCFNTVIWFKIPGVVQHVLYNRHWRAACYCLTLDTQCLDPYIPVVTRKCQTQHSIFYHQRIFLFESCFLTSFNAYFKSKYCQRVMTLSVPRLGLKYYWHVKHYAHIHTSQSHMPLFIQASHICPNVSKRVACPFVPVISKSILG